MKRRMPKLLRLMPVTVFAANWLILSLVCYGASEKSPTAAPANGRVSISRIAPDTRGGQAYKLVYLVRTPLDMFWKFKTDFDNNFLVTNKYIRDHRFVSRSGNQVITEDQYAHVPGIVFRWKTSVHPATHRLDFVLMNPEACEQKYHYGHIQLEPVAGETRVTQVAYFDFWGATIWANYPWGGGMKDFLTYTAHWEQETVLRLLDLYHGEKTDEKRDDKHDQPLNP